VKYPINESPENRFPALEILGVLEPCETVEKGTNTVIFSNFFNFDLRAFNNLRAHFYPDRE